MSYTGISVKEALLKINNSANGWFLPATQRPYVWGSRYENENYICKLFDSILKGYPIGGLIVWNTDIEVPYREFITHYNHNETQKIVDFGLHSRRDKWLIYDGQQRLQTLFSCLKYTFNEKILIFDLLNGLSDRVDSEQTGFSFVNKNKNIDWYCIRMNELFVKQVDDEKYTYRESIIKKNPNITYAEKIMIEKNIDKLWDIFVKTTTNSLAYFPIITKNENVVNEIFERLNTGGMALSLADILFSKIKAKYYDFEENLQSCSKNIYNSTGKGFIFNAYNILQILNLIVKQGVRIDPKKVKDVEFELFKSAWDKLEIPLLSFFSNYIYNKFGINNSSIIPRNLALLPIIIYFFEIYNKGFEFKHFSSQNLNKINQYFIKSQINDWNLQSYIDNFTKIIVDISEKTNDLFEFPLDCIESHISEKKLRNIDIYEETFIGYLWFSLKILTPNRIYQFDPDMNGRFNPEIDHIFPIKLKNRVEGHEKNVDIIWNMQPTKGEINMYKTNFHPRDFFTDTSLNKKGDKIIGSKYISEYDFLFQNKENGRIDFTDSIWDDPLEFIKYRKTKMIEFLKFKYEIEFKNIGINN